MTIKRVFPGCRDVREVDPHQQYLGGVAAGVALVKTSDRIAEDGPRIAEDVGGRAVSMVVNDVADTRVCETVDFCIERNGVRAIREPA